VVIMLWARLSGNIVQEIWPPAGQVPEGMTPANSMPPEFAAQFVFCPDNVQPNWIYDNGTYRPLTKADAPVLSQPDLTDYAAEIRWRVETGSVITVNGHPIFTNPDTQRKIDNIVTGLKATPPTLTEPVAYKLADETFLDATLSDLTGFYSAIVAHIQICFDTEEQCRDAIAAGTLRTRFDVEQFFSLVKITRKNMKL
jgi:hypothetical protein